MTGSPFSLALAALTSIQLLATAGAALGEERAITALGRLEPGDGVIRLAGPSGPAPVIAELRVEQGEDVERDQIVAVLDSHGLRKAELERLEAELGNAQRELRRMQGLHRARTASASSLDSARLAVRVAEAEVQAARERLDLSFVRSPVSGQVLEIHAREGERLGTDGLMELGETSRMYAVAEVYETDIGRVQPGQRASITSTAFEGAREGIVERVGMKIGKMDVLGTDPVAKADARVVEVRIRLDEGHSVERLTHLQVEVAIDSEALPPVASASDGQ